MAPSCVEAKEAGGGGGKHAIMAALKRLHHEERLLQEELQELEGMETTSAVCKELLEDMDSRPDPLLPLDVGLSNPTWERWILGPQELQGCGCCIL